MDAHAKAHVEEEDIQLLVTERNSLVQKLASLPPPVTADEDKMTDADVKYLKLQKMCCHMKERIECLEHAKQFKDLLHFLTTTESKQFQLESKLIQRDSELTFANN